jgi:hypothetical protein
MICFPSITGRLIAAIAQGSVESILFALANSNAPALCGLNRRDPGLLGFPGWSVVGPSPCFVTSRRDGERSGEEKERRYSAMKKVSLNRQNRKRTVWTILAS